jgi:hypothetical protein
MPRCGSAGKVRHGVAWRVRSRHDMVWFGRHGTAGLVVAWSGKARCGVAGTAWSGKVRFGMVRRGEAGMVWQSLEGN